MQFDPYTELSVCLECIHYAMFGVAVPTKPIGMYLHDGTFLPFQDKVNG